jgi:ubiquinone/menaquinone biosynthesis C-methylase UbiE
MSKKENIKELVREKYAEIAMKTKPCCCGSDKKTEYSVFSEDYNHLPGYMKEADMNLGCGVPVEHAGMKPGDSVIDLGCGAGNDCFVARALVGETGLVTGLDFTDEMLTKAVRNTRYLGYENVNFIKGDIENIPVEDGSFDVVISNCVLNLVPDKPKAFSEIKRILKPVGHFCVSDIVLKGELPPIIRETAALYAGCVSGALQMDEYLEIIHAAGYEEVEVKAERVIDVPDSLFLKHVTQQELERFKATGTGIFSITVVGKAG